MEALDEGKSNTSLSSQQVTMRPAAQKKYVNMEKEDADLTRRLDQLREDREEKGKFVLTR